MIGGLGTQKGPPGQGTHTVFNGGTDELRAVFA
ncbi:hypothetical protein SAMN04489716_9132 [Actinoplanes derwentensis]|uniref:Uncharacterized protein n=1 Tax=Actinoplanes derwentensis TaxID=113562 RepID=A0A1H2DBZ6_9ACTN|nr:hypothetical protein SAMN04489716_9132 [Actinoplanes derwentensis]